MDRRWLSVVRPNVSVLVSNWSSLINTSELVERRLISVEELESLSRFSREKQCQTLLADILPKKGPNSYEKFRDMLHKTGCENVLELLDTFEDIASESEARYVNAPQEKETRLSTTSVEATTFSSLHSSSLDNPQVLSTSEESYIALEYRRMKLVFKKAQTLQKDVGEAGGKISCEFSTVTIPPGAIIGQTLLTGFTIYEYQPEESEGVQDDTEVTDVIALHPCGANFAKNVEIRMTFNSSDRFCFLLYEGPAVGCFSATVCKSGTPTQITSGMTATHNLSSIDISTRHFCKLFACLFGCAGHCYRPLAFGRWTKGESLRTATIDLHFTSSKLSYVDHVERCNKGLPRLLKDYNVRLFFLRSDPIGLKITRISPGWELVSTPPRKIPKQELIQAKKSPSKYCSRSFTLKRILEDAEDPWLEVQLTGGKTTDCLLTLKEYTSSPVVRAQENVFYCILSLF